MTLTNPFYFIVSPHPPTKKKDIKEHKKFFFYPSRNDVKMAGD